MSHPKENQCKHTFEIIYKKCQACSGWNTACQYFEAQNQAEEKRKMKEIIVGSVVVHMNNGYPAYKAKDVHMTGLPIYTSIDRRTGGVAEHLQSTTQRKKAGFPVQENECPLGWYRVMNGYVPLYKEEKHK